MISKRLQIFLQDIAHHLFVLGAALLFLMAVTISLLHWLLPFLPEHEILIATTLSQLVGAEVQFDKMQIGWYHLHPEIELQNVQIENAAHQTLLRIPQVAVRLSLLSSLIDRKPVVSLLQIKQWHVRVYQNTQGRWQVSGIEHLSALQNTEKKIQLDAFFSALSQIEYFRLVECHIDIQSQNASHLILADTDLDWTFKNHVLAFDMQSNAGNLVLGTLFRDDMPFEQMKLAGTWQSGEQGAYQLSLNTADLQTSDAHLHAQLQLIGADQKPTAMNLLGTVDMPLFNQISHYLPVGIMAPALVHWLDHAIVGGKNLQASILWRGALNNFPFHDQSGTMQIAGQVQGVTLDYAPGWPKITDLAANLYFTSHGMHVVATHGFLAEMPISQVTADIPFQKSTAVSIHGVLDTYLEKAWSFLIASRLEKTLAPLLHHTNATGPAHISLNLNIPLNSADDEVRYQGQIVFNHDQLTMRDAPIQINDLTGTVGFSEHILTGALLGQWFDEPWHITLDKKWDAKKIQLEFSGRLPFDQWILKNFAFATHWFSGRPSMMGSIDIETDDHPAFSMRILSDLKGLSMHAPMGINKAADTVAPFHLTLNTLADSSMAFNANWAAPQGPISVSSAHNHWSIHLPFVDAQFVEPSATQNAWKINLFDLDLRHLDDHLASTVDLPKSMPAMNIQATRVHLKSMFIPYIGFDLKSKEHGMSINNFLLRMDQFSIAAQGESDNQPLHTTLHGNLTTNHLADTLKMLDFGDLLDAEDTNIHFDISWPGALWQFTRNQLSGLLNFTIHKGVFKNLSAQTNNQINLGRMLSLLSIQALPQHFNNIEGKGFAFGRLSGTVRATPNQLNQINVAIHGEVAEVLLQGCVNLEDSQLNLITKINPNVTGSLPVLAALAGGPILGALGFVANQFLEPMVGKIGESYYAIQGAAHDPETTKVSRIRANEALRHC